MGLKERRLREKEQRRAQIIEAARSLILKHGVFSVSVQQVAKLAELSVGTIYLYFSSKEAIFATLQEEILDYLHSKCSDAIKGVTDPKKRIEKVTFAYKRFSEENKRYFDVINYFLSPSDVFFPDTLKSEIDQYGNRILSLLVDAINDGIEREEFGRVNARRSAIVLWGTLHGLIQFRKLKDTVLRGEDFDELYSFSVERFIDGLAVRRGAGAQGSLKTK